MNENNDHDLFLRLKSGDVSSLKVLFNRLYSPLCVYAYQFIQNSESAEEIVQDTFVKIWETRDEINVIQSFKSYLFTTVKNKCINYVEHEKIKNKYANQIIANQNFDINPDDFFIEPDLLEKIEKSINSLPPKRKEIFKLSRESGLKYKEIAAKLDISVKTVEAQMSLAIKQLRTDLKDYKNYLITFLLFQIK